MKQNDLFMKAYIFFLVICTIIKGFYSFPMWDCLLTAITLSSGFFAYADLFSSLSKTYQNLSVQTIEYNDKILHFIQNEETQFEKLKNVSKVPGAYTSNEIEISINDLNDLRDSIGKTKETAEKGLEKSKRCLIAGETLTIIGFILFFVILVIPEIAEWCLPARDSITVGAFAIILSTNYFRSNSDVVIERINTSREKTIEKYRQLTTNQKLLFELASALSDEGVNHAD